MTKDKRTLLWASFVFAPILLFFGLVLVFPLANLGSAIASLILERRPARAELTGDYKYSAAWGAADLHLDSGGAFTESISERGRPLERIAGSWTAVEDENSAKVDFRPFGMVWDEDHGRRTNLFGMNFYKPRLGNTYAKINDDLGEQFERQ